MKARLTTGMLGLLVFGALLTAAGGHAADRSAIGRFATPTASQTGVVDAVGRWGGRRPAGAIGRYRHAAH